MSRYGRHVPGISCTHKWALIKDTHQYKCANCPATCTRNRGMIETYSNFTEENK
jgi:hypothetical protein